MNKYVVIDLDGTLTCLDHRLHLVRQPKPDWDLFYKMAVDDGLHQWCKILINALHDFGYRVLLVSARPESIRGLTKTWLAKHGVNYDRLYLLRGKKNYTPDDDLKMAWLKEFGKEKILFVVDDRPKVVRAWRNEGMVVLTHYGGKDF